MSGEEDDECTDTAPNSARATLLYDQDASAPSSAARADGTEAAAAATSLAQLQCIADAAAEATLHITVNPSPNARRLVHPRNLFAYKDFTCGDCSSVGEDGSSSSSDDEDGDEGASQDSHPHSRRSSIKRCLLYSPTLVTYYSLDERAESFLGGAPVLVSAAMHDSPASVAAQPFAVSPAPKADAVLDAVDASTHKKKRTAMWRAAAALEWVALSSRTAPPVDAAALARLEADARATSVGSSAWGAYATYTLADLERAAPMGAYDDNMGGVSMLASLLLAKSSVPAVVESAFAEAFRVRAHTAATAAELLGSLPPHLRLLASATHWAALEAAGVSSAQCVHNAHLTPALASLLVAVARALPSLEAATLLWPPGSTASASAKRTYGARLVKGVRMVAAVLLHQSGLPHWAKE
jgi:hypothetical protein